MKKDISANEKHSFFKNKKRAIMTIAGGAVALVLVAVGVVAAFQSDKSNQPVPEETASVPAVETQESSEPSVPSVSQEGPEASEAVPVVAPSESAAGSAFCFSKRE